MQLGKALSKLEHLQLSAKNIHEAILANELSTDKSKSIFEKLDKKLNSIKNNCLKVHKMPHGDYIYKKPVANPATVSDSVTEEFIKTKLESFKNDLVLFQSNWKDEDYKVVDPQNNKIANLNNTNRGNVTKAIGDIEDLISEFS